MGIPFANFGLLTGATETLANTEEAPIIGIRLIGQPDYTRDESFDAPDFLTLDPDFAPGDRVKNTNGLTFSAAVTYMTDALTVQMPSECVFNHTGWEESDAGLATGSGNFFEMQPKSSGFEAATFHGFLKEDATAGLTRKKHIGTRGNGTLTLEPGAGNVLQYDVDSQSKHAFWEEFDTQASLAPPSLDTSAVHSATCWSMTIDGLAVDLVSFNVSPNFEIALAEDQVTTCDSGADDIPLEPQQMTGNVVMKFQEELIGSAAGNHIRTAIESNDDKALVFERDDGVQIFRVTIPKARFQEVALATGDERYQWSCDFVAQPTVVGATDQITLRWEVV